MNNVNIIRRVFQEKERDLENKLSTNPIFLELQEIKQVLIDLNNNIVSANQNGMPSNTKLTNLVEALQTGELYVKTASYINKAVWVLKKYNTPLTTRQISDEILLKEPEINKDTLISSLSSILGTYSNVKKKTVTRVKNEAGDWEYLLI